MKRFSSVALLLFAPLFVIVFSILIGPAENISVASILLWCRSSLVGMAPADPLVSTILFDVRLPRILLTFLVGSALAVSGNALQAVFRNPLIDPYILGISSGAACGAAFALATGYLPVQLSAFLFAAVAVAMSFSFARIHKTISTVAMILAGVVVSGVFTALLTVIQFLSDPFRLQTIVHWMMGNLHTASWSKLESCVIPILAGMVIIVLWRWRLNVLALGDEEAIASGVRPERERALVVMAATVATAAAVAVAGIIGFYGLFIPHIVRMIAGADNRRTVPLNIAIGGSFLVLIDDISRSATSFEIPIGVFTLLLGAPLFVFLMKKSRIGWQE